MLFWQFSNITIYVKIVGKIADQHLYVWLFSHPGDKVQILVESTGQRCTIVQHLFWTFSLDLRITIHSNVHSNAGNYTFQCTFKCLKNTRSTSDTILRGGGDNRAATELSFSISWAYSGVFGIFREKKIGKKTVPPTQITFLKIQCNINFLKRHFLEQNAPFFFIKVYIYHFIKKLLSDFILDLWKCLNQKTHKIRRRKKTRTHLLNNLDEIETSK